MVRLALVFLLAGTLALVPRAVAAEPIQLSTSTYSGPPATHLVGAVDIAVAENPALGQRLALWAESDGSAPARLHARLIDESGRPLGAVRRISYPAGLPDSFSDRAPAATYNAATGEYLVVWTADTSFDRRRFVVLSQRVDAGGRPLGRIVRVSRTQPIHGLWEAPRKVAVAASSRTGSYLVAWQGYPGDRKSGPLSVLGRRIGRKGGRVGPIRRLGPSGSGKYSSGPSLARDPRRDAYLVLWARGHASSKRSDVLVRSVSATGRAIGGVVRVARARFPADYLGRGPGPELARDTRRGSFLATWEGPSGTDKYGNQTTAIFDRRLSPRGDRAGPARRISGKRNLEDRLKHSALLYSRLTDRYQAAWSYYGGESGSHCVGSDFVRAQALAPSGRQVGPNDLDAQVDMPGQGGTDDFGNPCRPIAIRSLALARGPASDTLLLWTGSVAGRQQHAWSRPLSG